MASGKEKNGIEEIYEKYYKDVYRFVLALSKNPHIAEDITQETFVKAIKAVDRFKGDCDIKVWLCQIAKNTYFTYAGKQNREQVDVDAVNNRSESQAALMEDVDSDDFEFDKFCCWFADDNKNVPEFREYVSQHFDYIDRGSNFCEIVPKGFSKATGIQYLLDYFDIPLENAYAFGDGNNDAPMLLYCPNSIIMEKGPEELKRQVMMVTDDAENDGIYKAMVKLGIIEPME